MSKIKVALIDNMNNCFFSFARYLRDLGFDAYVYEVSDSSIYFKPQADTFEDISKIEYIKKFPVEINPKEWFLLDKKKIYNEFKNYDIIISAGLSSAYLKKSQIDSDIIIPFGSDLYDIPFFKFKLSSSLKDILKSFVRSSYAKYQKSAYLDARAIAIHAGSKLYEEPLKKLKINWLNIHSPMLYNLEDTSTINLQNYINKDKLKKLENSDFVVFNHARHYWTSNEDKLEDFDKYLGLKRNDRVIRAFARFLKVTKYKNPILVLFEYGLDVNDSKNLIKSLGIENNILWMPKSPRKVIRLLIQKYCNIGTDQFRERISAGLSSVSYEVLSSAKPFVTYIANMSSFFEKSPIIRALNSDDILNIFIDYEKNPSKYEEIGKKSKEWFDSKLGIGLAKRYAKMINLFVENKKLSQNDKVIRDIFRDLYE